MCRVYVTERGTYDYHSDLKELRECGRGAEVSLKVSGV